MDFRAVDGAGEEGFTGNQLILVIQIQHPELFAPVPPCSESAIPCAARVEVKKPRQVHEDGGPGFRAR